MKTPLFQPLSLSLANLGDEGSSRVVPVLIQPDFNRNQAQLGTKQGTEGVGGEGMWQNPYLLRGLKSVAQKGRGDSCATTLPLGLPLLRAEIFQSCETGLQ